ncbi:YagU family protein [Rhizobium paknamense]|uniref:Membrane protein n=1 Tax=Rhizobium paknamense TaxID=1206817 RepID=A0ABU0IAI7_9HYPH|nr:DUF1440 domain-containing protein [Rhizobium paknamense]MDQ0454296.1 putative membrane protein [Rhizobium paknamense]
MPAPAQPRFTAALVAGFIGGNLSSFVKWGTENPLPPRTPDRAIPPAEMLQDMGFNVKAMTYTYSDHVVNWGVAGVHHLFSIGFAMAYCLAAEILPLVTLWQGLLFGLIVTVAFHGVVLPVFGWAPPLWQLPLDELVSETIGHLLWAWTIEIVRRDFRHRLQRRAPYMAHKASL